MPNGHPDLPTTSPVIFSKKKIFNELIKLDNNTKARNRILKLETDFRLKIQAHIASLPAKSAKLAKFNTSPYVLLIHSLKNNYSKIKQIEGDILPAKQFSSMETSAGRMVEEVVLPVYKWKMVPSSMHSANSALDGMKKEKNLVKLVTLKSGPRCLNDEMSENFADTIISHAKNWASTYSVNHIDFTYGVLYGTQKKSNKKDWHILRNLMDKLPISSFSVLPKNIWNCSFVLDGINVDVNIRIGQDWWVYLGGKFGLLEMIVSLIRATIKPISMPKKSSYIISDLTDICSIDNLDKDYNISLLQKSQLEWFLLTLYHFCDKLEE